MPELPEVETIKNELLPHVVGRRISGVELLWEGIVKYPTPDEFRAGLPGRKIAAGRRRGKYLLLALSDGGTVVFHLKMSGSLLLDPDSAYLQKYIRAVICLDDGRKIYFRDPRKFGRMWLVREPDMVIGDLGHEPLEPGFTPEVLASILKGRISPVKAVIMDQSLIAGVGNMYADEALFEAGIHPVRASGSLRPDEVRKLHEAILKVLRAAIIDKGASIVNYYRPDGEPGTAHFQFRVAHRRNERCLVCGGPVERITVRNRGTYFCPKCQPLEPRGR